MELKKLGLTAEIWQRKSFQDSQYRPVVSQGLELPFQPWLAGHTCSIPGTESGPRVVSDELLELADLAKSLHGFKSDGICKGGRHPAGPTWDSSCFAEHMPRGHRFRDLSAVWKLVGPSITQDLSPEVSSKARDELSEKRCRLFLRSCKSIWPLVASYFRLHLIRGSVDSLNPAATQLRVRWWGL